ncbi:peptidylprolyl isomerase [Chryseobacterium nematophagum]|uniref:Peptidylprolyl isomerase n=1 Tax=Chryseobacterium nematophagum TaxID=2305228 RepID=A0A3M7TJ81_9FLAO|nr:peptidylprolyl isomerase [Chryseobacterium nematophagum]RNA62260.1 peptidylprolyl isomerase [Chryseobacterium nematophagum]
MRKIYLILSVLVSQLYLSQDVNTEMKKGKTELTSELNVNNLNFYNTTFLKFVSALKSPDLQVINTLISDKVKNVVTEDVVQKLSGGISFERNMVVFKSGYQSLADGGKYPTIQYKYEDDKHLLPRDILTVVFEDSGKILGVKPEYSE